MDAHLGTCGLIGTSWKIVLGLWGYDESTLAMGYQDIDPKRRKRLVGAFGKRRGGHLGFALSSRQNEVQRFPGASAEDKRKEKRLEDAEKPRWLPETE